MSEHGKPFRLATTAYQAALAGRSQAAVDAIQRINDECGGEGLNEALMAWCDTYMHHATDGQDMPNVGRVNFMRTDTGQLDGPGSDRVPAEIQWAGRMIAARVALDLEAWTAALDELPDDGKVIGDHVFAVLHTVSTTVNGLPRGFAIMGRSGGAA